MSARISFSHKEDQLIEGFLETCLSNLLYCPLLLNPNLSYGLEHPLNFYISSVFSWYFTTLQKELYEYLNEIIVSCSHDNFPSKAIFGNSLDWEHLSLIQGFSAPIFSTVSPSLYFGFINCYPIVNLWWSSHLTNDFLC
jgi:hypothetical protein